MYDIGLVQFDKMALWGLQFLRPIAGSEITCGSGFTLDSTWHSVLSVPTQSRGGAEIALKSHAAVASPTAMQHPIIASLTMSSLFYSNLYVVNWPRNPFLLRVSQASLSRRVYALLSGYPYHNPAAICDSHV